VLFALCPLVGVTGTVADGVAAGVLSTLTVLGSAVIIELFHRILPGAVTSLCHMIIVAGFTTGLTLILQGFAPQLVEELGLYLSMTVVCCLVLERLVAPSREQGTLYLLLDCVVTGLSLTLLLAAVSLMREFLGSGALFGFPVFGGAAPLPIMAGPFGGFFCVGCVAALVQGGQLRRKRSAPAEKEREAA
jgi:electron transport complex protein RnfE